jgi:hypothetical protein
MKRFTNAQLDIALTIIENESKSMNDDLLDIDLLRDTCKRYARKYIDARKLMNVIYSSCVVYDAIESREYTQFDYIKSFHELMNAIRELDY